MEKKNRCKSFYYFRMGNGRKNKEAALKLTSWLLCLAMAVGMLSGIFAPQSVEAAEDVPSILKAQLVSERDLEIYWDQKVLGADAAASFTITIDGKAVEISKEPWIWDEESWSWLPGGIVCYSTRNSHYPNNPDQWKTSISLPKAISVVSNLPIGDKKAVLQEIKVQINPNRIRSEAGAYVPGQTITVDAYEPFYQQEVKLDCGVRVLGSKAVLPEAMTKAAEMLEVILANETLAKRMGDAGCMLGIYGEGEIAYDILEHRYSYDENYLYVEGFGGTQLASIKDANVLRLISDGSGNYHTGYPNESILAHEFGHTVQNYGLDDAQKAEFENIYNTSTGNGKWANSYAGSNSSEYFATLTAIWFNAMDDTWDGKWDGVRGPINTREELKAYDKEAYDFMSKIYVSDQYLPAPWENGTVPDNYTYVDPNQPEPDNPEPDNPEQPEPDNPEQPEPDNPEQPEPDNPEPDKPEPDNPEQPKPDNPEQPKPDKPEPDKPDPVVKNYKVKFVYNNGKKTVAKTVKKGKKVTAPTSPKREGYYFEGWYLNGKKYSFRKKVTKNLTLRAKWSQIKAPKISSVKAKKGRKAMITFKLNNGTKVNGCKITFAKDKKFKKSVKTKIISSKKVTKWTTGKLSKGTYYFKIQAYRLDSKKSKILGKASTTKKLIIR